MKNIMITIIALIALSVGMHVQAGGAGSKAAQAARAAQRRAAAFAEREMALESGANAAQPRVPATPRVIFTQPTAKPSVPSLSMSGPQANVVKQVAKEPLMKPLEEAAQSTKTMFGESSRLAGKGGMGAILDEQKEERKSGIVTRPMEQTESTIPQIILSDEILENEGMLDAIMQDYALREATAQFHQKEKEWIGKYKKHLEGMKQKNSYKESRIKSFEKLYRDILSNDTQILEYRRLADRNPELEELYERHIKDRIKENAENRNEMIKIFDHALIPDNEDNSVEAKDLERERKYIEKMRSCLKYMQKDVERGDSATEDYALSAMVGLVTGKDPEEKFKIAAGLGISRYLWGKAGKAMFSGYNPDSLSKESMQIIIQNRANEMKAEFLRKRALSEGSSDQ